MFFTKLQIQNTSAETIVAEDTFAEALADFFEAIEEAAPAAAAAGGSVAAAAMFAMPPLPMTLASGVPPGTQPYYFLKLLKIIFLFWPIL